MSNFRQKKLVPTNCLNHCKYVSLPHCTGRFRSSLIAGQHYEHKPVQYLIDDQAN